MATLLESAFRDALVLGLENDSEAERILEISRPFIEQAFADHLCVGGNVAVLFPDDMPQQEPEPFSLPAGSTATVGHVPVDKIRMAHHRNAVSIEDVTRCIQFRIRASQTPQWPALRGYWEGDQFVLTNGRPDYIACLMLGLKNVLAVWPQNGRIA